MVAELRLYRFGYFAFLQLERTDFKLFHHLSTSKLSQITALFAAWAEATLLGNCAKGFALLETFLEGFGFGESFDEYMGTSNFVWHSRM